MKTRNGLIAAATVALVVLGFMIWRHLVLRSAYDGVVSVRFAVLGKWRPGTFTSGLPGHYDAFVREWLASGTNVAVFTLTNGRNRSLLLYPYVGLFEGTNATRSRYESVLASCESRYGTLLRAGETATVEVAILPGKGPGFVRFGYSPNYRDFLPRLIEELRGLITDQSRPTFRNEWIYSDRIDP